FLAIHTHDAIANLEPASGRALRVNLTNDQLLIDDGDLDPRACEFAAHQRSHLADLRRSEIGGVFVQTVASSTNEFKRHNRQRKVQQVLGELADLAQLLPSGSRVDYRLVVPFQQLSAEFSHCFRPGVVQITLAKNVVFQSTTHFQQALLEKSAGRGALEIDI